MAKDWEQKPDEPDLWYGRFYKYYLPLGLDRTLDAAYVKFRQEAGKATAKIHERRAQGHWIEAAKAWRWRERCRAWDKEERDRLREEHFKLVRETQRKHQIVLGGMFGKVLKKLPEIAVPDDMSFAQALQIVGNLIDRERTVIGMPMTIEAVQPRFGKVEEDRPDSDAALDTVSIDVDPKLPAEQWAEVLAVLDDRNAYPDDNPGQVPESPQDAGQPLSEPEILPAVAPDAQADGVPGP